MMSELEHKHKAEIDVLQSRRDEKIAECKKKYSKK
jgi:hypothetical protein